MEIGHAKKAAAGIPERDLSCDQPRQLPTECMDCRKLEHGPGQFSERLCVQKFETGEMNNEIEPVEYKVSGLTPSNSSLRIHRQSADVPCAFGPGARLCRKPQSMLRCEQRIDLAHDRKASAT